jgi:hypothetical protein
LKKKETPALVSAPLIYQEGHQPVQIAPEILQLQTGLTPAAKGLTTNNTTSSIQVKYLSLIFNI